MAWDDRLAWLDVRRAQKTDSGSSILAEIARRVDDRASARLLAASTEIEDALLEGVVVEEGEGSVSQALAKAVEHARSLERGYVLAVVYSREGYEARIRVDAGGERVAVAVIAGGRSLAGHEALRIYGRLKGEYQVVVVED